MLVAGMVLAGALLTACESAAVPPSDTAVTENRREEIEKTLREQVDDFGLGSIQIRKIGPVCAVALQDDKIVSFDGVRVYKTVFVYEISEELYNTLYREVSKYRDGEKIRFDEHETEGIPFVVIDLNQDAIRENDELVTWLYRQVKAIEPRIEQNGGPQQPSAEA